MLYKEENNSEYLVEYTISDCLALLDILRSDTSDDVSMKRVRWTFFFEDIIQPLKIIHDREGEVSSKLINQYLRDWFSPSEYAVACRTELSKIPLLINNSMFKTIVQWRLKIVK